MFCCGIFQLPNAGTFKKFTIHRHRVGFDSMMFKLEYSVYFNSAAYDPENSFDRTFAAGVGAAPLLCTQSQAHSSFPSFPRLIPLFSSSQ